MFKKIFNLLFPIECVSCGRNDFLLCNDCLNKIKINKVNSFSNEFIEEVHVCSSFHNRLLQKIMHLYKYQYVEDFSKIFSKIIFKYFSKIEEKIKEPIAIPVPLHQKKLLSRCFNQADLIAQNFCNDFNYKINRDLVCRIKNTKQQAKLNKKERLENVKNSFTLSNSQFVKNKNFIIVDDIYTTGSTVSEIAKLLKKGGANKIWCIVIAKN